MGFGVLSLWCREFCERGAYIHESKYSPQSPLMHFPYPRFLLDFRVWTRAERDPVMITTQICILQQLDWIPFSQLPFEFLPKRFEFLEFVNEDGMRVKKGEGKFGRNEGMCGLGHKTHHRHHWALSKGGFETTKYKKLKCPAAHLGPIKLGSSNWGSISSIFHISIHNY